MPTGLLTRLNQSRQSLDQLDELMRKPVERPFGKHLVKVINVHHRSQHKFAPDAEYGSEDDFNDWDNDWEGDDDWDGSDEVPF